MKKFLSEMFQNKKRFIAFKKPMLSSYAYLTRWIEIWMPWCLFWRFTIGTRLQLQGIYSCFPGAFICLQIHMYICSQNKKLRLITNGETKYKTKQCWKPNLFKKDTKRVIIYNRVTAVQVKIIICKGKHSIPTYELMLASYPQCTHCSFHSL